MKDQNQISQNLITSSDHR